MGKLTPIEKEMLESRAKRDNRLHTYDRTGVFEEKVNNVIVGYFVGWRSHWGENGRNIRAGLYFKTADEAIAYRDDLEHRRTPLESKIKQIA